MTDPVPSKERLAELVHEAEQRRRNAEGASDYIISFWDDTIAILTQLQSAPEPPAGYVDPDLQSTSAAEPEPSNDWGVREAFKTIESYVTPGSAIPGAVLYLKREIRNLEKMVIEESARASQPPGDVG